MGQSYTCELGQWMALFQVSSIWPGKSASTPLNRLNLRGLGITQIGKLNPIPRVDLYVRLRWIKSN